MTIRKNCIKKFGKRDSNYYEKKLDKNFPDLYGLRNCNECNNYKNNESDMIAHLSFMILKINSRIIIWELTKATVESNEGITLKRKKYVIVLCVILICVHLEWSIISKQRNIYIMMLV